MSLNVGRLRKRTEDEWGMKVAGAARPAVVDLEGQALLGEAMRGGHDGSATTGQR